MENVTQLNMNNEEGDVDKTPRHSKRSIVFRTLISEDINDRYSVESSRVREDSKPKSS